jgi:hypothetical protein
VASRNPSQPQFPPRSLPRPSSRSGSSTERSRRRRPIPPRPPWPPRRPDVSTSPAAVCCFVCTDDLKVGATPALDPLRLQPSDAAAPASIPATSSYPEPTCAHLQGQVSSRFDLPLFPASPRNHSHRACHGRASASAGELVAAPSLPVELKRARDRAQHVRACPKRPTPRSAEPCSADPLLSPNAPPHIPSPARLR